MSTQATAEADEAAEAAAQNAAAEKAFKQTVSGEAPEAPAEPEAPAPAAAVPAAEPAAPAAAEPSAEDKAAEEARLKREEEEWLKAVPPSVREGLQLVGRMRNFEGHIGGLTTVTKELKASVATVQAALDAATKAATTAGAEAPTAEQVKLAAGSSAKWKQMKEDFPEWAEAMDERLAEVAPGRAAEPIDQDKLRRELREEIRRDLNLERVEEVHEGWQATVKTPEFEAWYKTQPDDMKALAASDRARDAIKMLDAYAKSKEGAAGDPPPDDPKARLDAAVVPTRGRSVTRSETITEEQAAQAAFKRVRTGS